MIPDRVLDEESIILAELNRRLFSSLRIIGALVCRGAHADEPETQRPFPSDLNRRIEMLAVAHQLLASVVEPRDLEEHCHTICCALARAFGRADITPRVTMEELPLSPSQAFRIPLVVVELVTGAMKHGVGVDNDRSIWINLRETPMGIELSVCDSGSESYPASEVSRFVEAIARTLGGAAFSVNRPGYTAGIRFPLGTPPVPGDWEVLSQTCSDERHRPLAH